MNWSWTIWIKIKFTSEIGADIQSYSGGGEELLTSLWTELKLLTRAGNIKNHPTFAREINPNPDQSRKSNSTKDHQIKYNTKSGSH